jgi:hypothetical protein
MNTQLQRAQGFAIGMFLIVISFSVTPDARSQTIQPDVKAFVTQYVAAYNAHDAARLFAMYGPKSLACITPETKSFYDDMMSHRFGDPIPPNYTFKVSPVNEDNLKGLESIGGHPPVQPTQELQIDYQQGDDSGSVIVYLVRENGRLFDDELCATDDYIKKYRENAAANAKLLAEYKATADAIKEPLRSQLMTLLNQHKTAEAIDRYKAASNQDTKTSMYVINALAQEAHLQPSH